MKKIKFTKAVASGNDFIIVDNRKKQLSDIGYRISDFAREVCQRKNSIGADGLLLIEKSKRRDFKMRIFNPDGSEPEMCGNGARCVALFAVRERIAPPKMEFETIAGTIRAEVRGHKVKVRSSDPKSVRLNLSLKLGGKSYSVHFVNIGVPHVIHFVKNLNDLDVKGIGSGIRYHREFKPAGTNANFVAVLNKKSVRVRTYERGVEDETLACGTGACASAIVASLTKGVIPPVKVRTRSGESLNVYFSVKGEKATDVFLEGPARLLYTGSIEA